MKHLPMLPQLRDGLTDKERNILDARLAPVVHSASGSSTDRLLQCTYWASPLVAKQLGASPWTEPTQDEKMPLAPRFGSAFHSCCELHLANQVKHRLSRPSIAAEALRFGADIDVERLENYYLRWLDYFNTLIARHHWKIAFVEVKLAYDPFVDVARQLKEKGARNYEGRRPNEFPMTLDLVLKKKDAYAVIDWKTGQGSYYASDNGQIRSGSLAVDRWEKPKSIIGMLVRIDDDFLEPNEYEFPQEALNKHRDVLANRLRDATAGPFMRTGPECTYCRALEICPAHRDTLGLGDMIDKMIEPEDVGRFYESRLAPAKKLVERLYERVGAYIDNNGPAPMPSGKYLTRATHSEELLSKASIIRGLGKVHGEELIEDLRKKGVVETTEKTQLRSVIDPSGRK
jgi:hypothetical protein